MVKKVWKRLHHTTGLPGRGGDRKGDGRFYSMVVSLRLDAVVRYLGQCGQQPLRVV